MRRCPECGAETNDPRDMRCICGAVIDGVGWTGRPPGGTGGERIAWGAPFGLKPSQPAVCVPRRFGVGTMMILTTAFAVLFGTLKTTGVDPIYFVAISLFIGGVAVCQVLMYQGKDPRRASFVGGIITAGVVTTVVAAVVGFQYHSWSLAVQTGFWAPF